MQNNQQQNQNNTSNAFQNAVKNTVNSTKVTNVNISDSLNSAKTLGKDIADEVSKHFSQRFDENFIKKMKDGIVQAGKDISDDFNEALFSSKVITRQLELSFKTFIPKFQSEILPKLSKFYGYYNAFSNLGATVLIQGLLAKTAATTLGSLTGQKLAFDYAEQTGQDLSSFFNVVSVYNPFRVLDLSPTRAKQNAFMTASAYSELEYQQTRVRTMIPKEEWEANERLIRKTTDALKNAVSTTEALALQYEVLSAGFTNAAEAAKVTEAAVKLTKAGFADAADTARLLVSTMQAYEMTAGEAASTAAKLQGIVAQGITTIPELANVFGQLSAVAAQAGASIEDVGAALAVLTQKGQSTNVASTSIQSLLMALISPSPGGEKALRRYSAMAGKVVDITPAAIRSKGLAETLIEIGEITNFDAQKLSEIFTETQSYRAAVSLLADRGVKMKNIKTSLGSKSASFLEEQFEISLGTQREQFVSFVNEAKALLEDIGKEIAPIFLDLIKSARELFEIFKAFPDVLKKGLAGLLQFKLILSGIVDAATSLLSGFMELGKLMLMQQVAGLGLRFLASRDVMIARFTEAQKQGKLLQTVLKELLNIDSSYYLLVNKLVGQGKSRAEAENIVRQAMRERGGDLTELLQKETALAELTNRRIAALQKLNQVAQEANAVASVVQNTAGDARTAIIERTARLAKTEGAVIQDIVNAQTAPTQPKERLQRRYTWLSSIGREQSQLMRGLQAILPEQSLAPIRAIQNEMASVREAIKVADSQMVQQLNARYQQLVQQYFNALNAALQQELKPLNNITTIKFNEEFLSQARKIVDDDNKRIQKLMPLYKKRSQEVKKNKEALDKLNKALENQDLTQKQRVALEKERAKAEAAYINSVREFQKINRYKLQSAETNALRKSLYMERLASNVERYRGELAQFESLPALDEAQQLQKQRLERKLARTEQRLQQVALEFNAPDQAIAMHQERIRQINEQIKAGQYADPTELQRLERQRQQHQYKINEIRTTNQQQAQVALQQVSGKPSVLSGAGAMDLAAAVGSLAYLSSSLPTVGKAAQGKFSEISGGDIANLLMSSLFTVGTLGSIKQNYSFEFLKPIRDFISSPLSGAQLWDMARTGVGAVAGMAGRISGIGSVTQRLGATATSMGFDALGAGLAGLASNKIFLGAAGIAVPAALGFGAYKIWEKVGSEYSQYKAKEDIVVKGSQAADALANEWDDFREKLAEIMDKNTEATQENTDATRTLSEIMLKLLSDGEKDLPKSLLQNLKAVLQDLGINPDDVKPASDEEFSKYLEMIREAPHLLTTNSWLGGNKENAISLVSAIKAAEKDPMKLLALYNALMQSMVKSGGYDSISVAQLETLKENFDRIERLGDPSNLFELLGPENKKIVEKIRRGEALTAEEADIIEQKRRKLSDSLEGFKAQIDAMAEQLQKELEEAIKNKDGQKIAFISLLQSQLADLLQRYGALEPKYKEAQRFGRDQVEGYNQFARNVELYGQAGGDATTAAKMLVQQELKGYQEAREKIEKEANEGKAKGNFMQVLRNNIMQEMDSIQQALSQGLMSYEEAVARMQKLKDYEITIKGQKTKVFNPTEQLEIEARLIELQKTKIEQEKEFLSLVQQIRDAINRTEYTKQIEQLTVLNNYVTAVAESSNKLADSVKLSTDRLKTLFTAPYVANVNERLNVLASMLAQSQNLKKQESDIALSIVNERRQAFEQTAQTNLQIMDKEKEIALLETEYQKRNISKEQRKIIEGRLLLLRQEKDLLELQNVSIQNQYRARMLNLELQQESVRIQKQMLKEEAAINLELANRNQQLAALDYNRSMFQDTVQTVGARGEKLAQTKMQVLMADNELKTINEKAKIELKILELLKKQNDLALKRQEIETKILQTKLKQEKLEIQHQIKLLNAKEKLTEADKNTLEIYQSQIKSIDSQLEELSGVMQTFNDMRQQLEVSFNLQRIGLEQNKISEIHKAIIQKEQAKTEQEAATITQKQSLLSSFYDNVSSLVSSYFRSNTRYQERRKQRVLANLEMLKLENETSVQEKILQIKEKELEITTRIKEIELATAKAKLESEVKILELKRQQAEQEGASAQQLQTYDVSIEALKNQLGAFDEQIQAVRELATVRRQEFDIERGQNRLNAGFRRMGIELMLAQANEGRFSPTIRQFEEAVLQRFGQTRQVSQGDFSAQLSRLFEYTQAPFRSNQQTVNQSSYNRPVVLASTEPRFNEQIPQRLEYRQMSVSLNQTNQAVSNSDAVTSELRGIRKDMVENFSTVIKVLQRAFVPTQGNTQQSNAVGQLADSLRVLNGLKK